MTGRIFRQLQDPMGPETLFIRIYCLMVATAFGLGVVVLTGGKRRFSNPNFISARELVSWTGASPSIIWGTMFAVLGILMILTIGKRSAVHLLRFGLVAYIFLSITFFVSATQNSVVSLTGAIAYLAVGAIHLVLAVHLDGHGWSGRGWE